jgi:hypothetical protein
VHRSSKLGARLAANGIEARLFLVSGAALALAFGRRRITRDLDAVFEPICAAWVTEDPRPELRIGGRVPYTRPTGDTGVVSSTPCPRMRPPGRWPTTTVSNEQREAFCPTMRLRSQRVRTLRRAGTRSTQRSVAAEPSGAVLSPQERAVYQFAAKVARRRRIDHAQLDVQTAETFTPALHESMIVGRPVAES